MRHKLKALVVITVLAMGLSPRAQQIGSNASDQPETFKLTLNSQLVVEQVVVQPAIQQKRNGISTPAGDAVTSRRGRIAVGFGDAGLQEREVQDVSAIQRSALNGFSDYAGPDRIANRVHLCHVPCDFDHLRGGPDLKHHIQPRILIDL